MVATWHHGIAAAAEEVNKEISKMPEAYRENLQGPSPARYPLPREIDESASPRRNMVNS